MVSIVMATPTRILETYRRIVGNTPTLLLDTKHGRQGVLIVNGTGNSTVYLSSNPNVAVSDGLPIPADSNIPLAMDGPIYGVASTNGNEVSIGCIQL